MCSKAHPATALLQRPIKSFRWLLALGQFEDACRDGKLLSRSHTIALLAASRKCGVGSLSSERSTANEHGRTFVRIHAAMHHRLLAAARCRTKRSTCSAMIWAVATALTSEVAVCSSGAMTARALEP